MASSNMKDIKIRIKSVGNTMQITKAMELVASSKLRKAKEKAEKTRPYFISLYAAMNRIATSTRGFSSIYTKEKDVKGDLYIVIAGDRGLAGGYNANVLKMAMANITNDDKVITIGKKSYDFFAKRANVVESYPDIAETLDYKDTQRVIETVLSEYKTAKNVYLYYTNFVSAVTQEASNLKLLPINFEREEKKVATALTEYDPSPEAVFANIMPIYLEGMIYGAIMESFASEQAARRMAMENATDNAKDMISELNLSYNRARQGAITQEITEIIAGSNAAR